MKGRPVIMQKCEVCCESKPRSEGFGHSKTGKVYTACKECRSIAKLTAPRSKRAVKAQAVRDVASMVRSPGIVPVATQYRTQWIGGPYV